MKKLLAILLSVMLLVGAMPLTAFAAMGGDFPWTGTADKMLIEEILERDGLIDGIWMPWFNEGQTGHNLTGNALMAKYNSSSTKDWNRVEMDYYGADKIYREIYNLKAMGYNIMAYGGSIFAEGVEFDANGDVTGIKQEYLDNARRLLNMCREIGMPVMWNIYFHSSSMPSYYGIEGWHYITQMLGNPDVADNYAEKFVRPLCQMLAEYPDVVALVSIADEPENEINDLGKGDHFPTNGREMYGVTQEDMIYFMQQINEVAREELPNVARTVASNNGNKTIYRDFDLDLMGHNQYTDGNTFKSVESLLTDADPILTEYNVGSRIANDTDFANKLITFRQWMMQNGYKGGFQWCWTPGQYTGAYALQRTATNTSFRKTVALLRYFMDEYRAEYRGETITLDAPVLYANEGNGKVLFIPSKRATKITVQRSDDGGNTWKSLATNVAQSSYVNSTYLIGTYTDSTTRPTSGYCYRIIASDDNGNTVTSAPNDLAGTDKTFKKTFVAPTYKAGEWYITSSLKQTDAKLTSFGVDKNRPMSESVNLIENGDFESTGGQWNNANFLQYASVVTDATTPSGSKSLHFNTSGVSTANWYNFTVTGLKANTEYTFSTFIKGAYLSNSNKGEASIGVIDPDTGKYMFYWEYFRSYPRSSRETKQIYPTAYDNDWHIRSVTFNTGERTSATIALYGASSQIWLDGMALYESANGVKYDNGESSKAVTSTKYEPASGATNAVTDPAINNAAYWNTGAGYKQGFMSIASGKLKYTASADPRGVRYTKWIDVKPGTDYYVSYTVNVTTAGSGRVAILDDAKLLPYENLTTSFSTTGTKTVTGRISTGKYDQLGLSVVDLGGVATIDNVYLYEAGASAVIPTTPSFDGYILNGDFEIGSSTGWENLWNNNTVELVDGRDSLFALKGTAGGSYTQVRQKITVEPNTDYVIEVWAKNVNGTTLIVKDSNDANLKQTGLQGSGSTWTKTVLEFNSGSHEFIYLGFMGSSAGKTWTVDDVVMTKKAAPEPVFGVVNGGFEDGKDGWTFGSGTNALVTDAHSGNKAIQLTNPGMWASAAEQTITVEPNTSYTITWWYKATPGTGIFNLYVMNAAGYANLTSTGGKNYMSNFSGGWEQGTYVVDSGSASAIILKFSTEASNPGTIIVDDVAIEKTAAHTHSYTSAVTKQPTCGATGVRTYTCSCGDSYTETIAATGNHTYANDCDGDCNVCGATRTVSHKYSGSCDQYCDLCGAKKGGLSIGVSHTYDNACDADCNVCGETRSVAGHSYTATVTKQPTCANTGIRTYTCTSCAHSYTEQIAATGAHTYANACDADCNVCGATRTPAAHVSNAEACQDGKCTVCGATVSATANHKYEKACDQNCSVCGEKTRPEAFHVYANDCDGSCDICGATREVGDHTYTSVVTKAPTCTATGVKTYTCSSCSHSYTETIAALGHNYKSEVTAPDCVNGGYTTHTCTTCGDTYKSDPTAATGHSYTATVTKRPNCVNTGIRTYTCSCGDSYTETIDATGVHSYDNICDPLCDICGYVRDDVHRYRTEVCKPTCTEEGYTWHGCDYCGDSYITNPVPATGHTPEPGGNCEDTQFCLVCFEYYIEPQGHSYHVEVIEPTCTRIGYTKYLCDRCDYIYSERIPATGHSIVHEEGVEATCTSLGILEHWYCTTCNWYWLDEACADNKAYDETIIYTPMTEHVVPNSCTGICQGCDQFIDHLADHNTVRVEATESTCITQGNVMYRYCVNCGLTWVKEATEDPAEAVDPDSVFLPLGDHTYDDDFDADCNVCGAIREAKLEVIYYGGRAVSEDVRGLAFRFVADVKGMKIKSWTAHEADYSKATVQPTTTSGDLKLVKMGAVLSNNGGDTYLDNLGPRVMDIPAKNLMSVDAENHIVEFAVRITNIPASAGDKLITARPYYIYQDAQGQQITVYGEEYSGTYNGVLGNH